jgi:hypothetical protein
MGFYVNVKSKTGCANQINDLWANKFKGFLIYTPKIIMEQIKFIKKDPKQQKLLYIDSVKIWNSTFPIVSQNKGQLFLRAYGYSEEKSNKFINENQELKDKMKFILDHRMLFKSITNIQDAVEALALDLEFEFYEDGKMQNYQHPTFSKMKQLHNNPVFQLCLETDRPDYWQVYLDIIENKLNVDNWNIIKNKVVPSIGFGRDTTLQRCEAILAKEENRTLDLRIHINKDNLPNMYNLLQAVSLNEQYFDTFLENINKPKLSLVA